MACYPLSSYVHLPTEPIPYESAMPDSRGHYIDGADADDAGHQQHQEQSQNRGCQQNGIGNHPVPIQIVRPQQVLCLISTSKFLPNRGVVELTGGMWHYWVEFGSRLNKN